jgi:hypothetical protein
VQLIHLGFAVGSKAWKTVEVKAGVLGRVRTETSLVFDETCFYRDVVDGAVCVDDSVLRTTAVAVGSSGCPDEVKCSAGSDVGTATPGDGVHACASSGGLRAVDTAASVFDGDDTSDVRAGETKEDNASDTEVDGTGNSNVRVSSRVRVASQRYPPSQYATEASCVLPGECAFVSVCVDGVPVEEPTTYQDALCGPHASYWLAVIESELASHAQNGTWELVRLPRGRRAVTSRWVFKLKLLADGTVDKFKARLCARGFTQRRGVDYAETFSPVARYDTIRAVLAMAAELGMVVHQLDVYTAFLNGELEEEVYMVVPDGLGEQPAGTACLLKKGLYGLKQSPRAWYSNLDECLRERLSYVRLVSDTCVYVRFCGDGMVVLVVYVDDFLVVATSLALMTVAKSELLSAYKCVDQGEVSWFLNMRVKRDAATGGISLDQSQYTLRVLERFGMLESNPVSTPADPGHVLTVAMCPDEEDVDHVEEMRGKPYRAAVGALMHLMVSTRPDIAAAVSSVARFASNPGRGHWAAVKRILRYLRGTVNYGVSFARAVGENGTVSLLAYSDSDWGGDRDTRRSTSGYLFLVGGGPVCWRSKLQATVATSTAEAKYVAVCAAIPAVHVGACVLHGVVCVASRSVGHL